MDAKTSNFAVTYETDAPRQARCRLAHGSDAAGWTDEIACLLRRRLRLAALVILAALALHFVRNLLDQASTLDIGLLGYALHAGTTIAIAALAGLLWSPWVLCMRALRIVEVAAFGITAAFLAWLQYEFFDLGTALAANADTDQTKVLRLVGMGSAFRWLILIVVYGMFIPNTWRRCATVVGCIALVPIILTLFTSLLDANAAAYARASLPDTLILMAVAIAIAIFGSHKIRELHEQVHEAQKFGRYQLKAKLGAGGMGEVYLAEHVLLRRPCAIKLIHPDHAGDPKNLKRFEREVKATATLTHWNTVEIYDFGHSDDGTFYYVMEYLPGLNLDDLVRRQGALPPERAIHFLRQVCAALHEAHGIGLIHRDIKPSNIFACERGKVHDVVKLLDFGLVKSFGMSSEVNLTQEGSLTGSPMYMSPEQATGRALDGRSDIYNVGAVAYYLVTGRLVFARETPLQLLHAHAYEPVSPSNEFRANIPADLQEVILRCLEKEPAKRFQNIEELDEALASCAVAGQWTQERAREAWDAVSSSGDVVVVTGQNTESTVGA